MPRRAQVLEQRDDLSILAEAVKAAGLDDTLDDPKAVRRRVRACVLVARKG
jgi:hypothetical protein